MKSQTSNKIVTITKSLITFGLNFKIFVLSLASITSLILLLGQFDISHLLPKGAELTFSAYDTWGGANFLVLTFVAANSLLTYGLIQFKKFLQTFKKADLFDLATVSFLKKGAILMAIVGAIQATTEWIINPAHIIINLSIAGWLFIASLVLSYFQKHFDQKSA